MTGQHPGQGGCPGTRGGAAVLRPARLLPSWRSALAVVAHPDDETFGLGALIDRLTASGTAVHVLCFTRGEASTLNENDSDLSQARVRELQLASSALGVAAVTLLNYPDSRLVGIPPAELAAQVTRLAALARPDGLLVFDDTGITGHPDHQAATRHLGLIRHPVVTVLQPQPVPVHGRLDITVVGHPHGDLRPLIDMQDRAAQRAAALMHASQVSPAAVLWRRLQLQGDCEHTRWLFLPGGEA